MWEVILQLLPVILELLKKDATQRAEAVTYGKGIESAALRSGDWKGVALGGIIQRLGKMSSEQQDVVVAAVEAAHATAQAQAAKGGAA